MNAATNQNSFAAISEMRSHVHGPLHGLVESGFEDVQRQTPEREHEIGSQFPVNVYNL